MNGTSVKYLLHEGLRNVWNNKLMSLASVGVLTACLMLVGFTSVLSINIDNMIGYVEQQSGLIIFLKDDATKEQTDDMLEGLQNLDCIEQITYLSKEQALSDYLKSLNDPLLAEELEGDLFLPASFQVSLNDVSQMQFVIDTAQHYECCDTISAPTGAADTISSLKNTAAVFGMVILLALIIVSLVIISNTIRATIFTRRTEIGIMKQVGATNNFIRIPFLVEGMTLGLISAAVAFIIVWVGYETVIKLLNQGVSGFLSEMYKNIIPFSNICWMMVLCFLIAGILTGAIGSVLSLRKHLKV